MISALWTIIVAELIAIAIAALYYLTAKRENAELREAIERYDDDARARNVNVTAASISRVASAIEIATRTIEANGRAIASLAGVHDRIAHALERIGRSEVWGGDPVIPIADGRPCPLCDTGTLPHDAPPHSLCAKCASAARTGRAPQ